MILKIVDQENITIGGVQVYENNADGKLTVQDTYHISALEYGTDSIFGSNEEQVTVIIDIAKFKENDFYDCCMESICNRLEVGVGPVSDRAYEIWSIIEEEYL